MKSNGRQSKVKGLTFNSRIVKVIWAATFSSLVLESIMIIQNTAIQPRLS